MKTILKYITLALLLSSLALHAQATGSTQALQDSFIHLKGRNGHLFFPVEYARLRIELSALEKSASNSNWNSYRDQYEDLEKDLQLWLANSSQAATNTSSALDARSEAVLLKAEQFAEDFFLKGDKQLQKAAAYVAEGNIGRAEKHVDNARILYKKAELEAVRNNLIGEVRILIHESLDLKANELAPEAYAKARQMMEETEQMVRLGKGSTIDISSQSQRLVKAANTLLQRVQTIHPLYKVKSNIEGFLVNLEGNLALVAEELDLLPNSGANVDDLLNNMHQAAKNLNNEKSILIKRNRQLVEEKQELEQELAQYRDKARVRQQRQNEINRFKAQLNQHVLQDDNKLTVLLDSLAFDEESDALTPVQRARLNELSIALQLLNIHALEVRYISYSTSTVSLQQHLAGKRAEKIRDHLNSLLNTRSGIQAQGIAYQSDFSSQEAIEGRVELIIDLGETSAPGYISTGYKNGSGSSFSE